MAKSDSFVPFHFKIMYDVIKKAVEQDSKSCFTAFLCDSAI